MQPSTRDPRASCPPEDGFALARRYRFIGWTAASPFVDRIVLYGSRARRDHHDRSDIDLAVACPRATPAEWLDLVELVDERADTLLAVDLVRLDALTPTDRLRLAIEREGVELYRREP